MAKLLIVDDEEKIRAVIREYAHFNHYETAEAEDGMQAVNMCLNEDFDLIIMDIMMPKLDGYAAVKEIKREKDIPVIMLSARGEEYDKLFGFELGIDDYVVKPFSPKELMARVAAVLARRNVASDGKLPAVLKSDGLVVNTDSRTVTVDGMKRETVKSLDAFLAVRIPQGEHTVVLDYELNHNEEVLKALEPQASRIEILVDEICFPGCPKRKEHYADESRMQLEFEKGTVFPCPNRTTRPSFAECRKREAFISREELGGYIERGYRNFKLVGRGLPIEMVKESYLYYLVKENDREYISRKLDDTLARLTGKR